MKRLVQWQLGYVLALAVFVTLTAIAAAILRVSPMGPATYDASRCHRLALVDQDSGRPVVGAEDIALAPSGDHVIVSAHDRSAAAGTGDGNLFAVPVASLVRARYTVAPLVATEAFNGGFRPHGFAIADASAGDAGGDSFLLAVIRRRDGATLGETTLQRASTAGEESRDQGAGAAGASRGRASLEVFRLEAAVGATRGVGGGDASGVRLTHVASLEDERLCRANDLAQRGTQLFVTLDRAACDASWRDTLGGDTGRLAAVDIDPVTGRLASPRIVAEGIAFANGVVRDDAGALVVAQTRGDALLAYPRDASGLKDAEAAGLGEPVALPLRGGGADNLSVAPDGRILAPVHPHLLRLALARSAPWLGIRAGSRVLAIDPADGSSEVLFDDPTGRLFQGATSAVLTTSGTLVMGSATDRGLLVCNPAHFLRRGRSCRLQTGSEGDDR